MYVMADLEEYLLSEYTVGLDKDTIAPDEDLLEQGIVDSLGILRLVAFIERKFNIFIPDEKVIPENFDTIQSLSSLVNEIRMKQNVSCD